MSVEWPKAMPPCSLKLGNVVPLLLAVAACWPVYFAVMSAGPGHFVAPPDSRDSGSVLGGSDHSNHWDLHPRGASVEADTDDEVLHINHLQRQHCEPS